MSAAALSPKKQRTNVGNSNRKKFEEQVTSRRDNDAATPSRPHDLTSRRDPESARCPSSRPRSQGNETIPRARTISSSRHHSPALVNPLDYVLHERAPSFRGNAAGVPIGEGRRWESHRGSSNRRSRSQGSTPVPALSIEQRHLEEQILQMARDKIIQKDLTVPEQFRHWDYNKDGRVSKLELVKRFKEFNFGFSEKDLNSLAQSLCGKEESVDLVHFVKAFDKAGPPTKLQVLTKSTSPGGSSIDPEKARKLLKNVREKFDRRGLRYFTYFKRFDDNGDGYISKQELKRHLALMNFKLTEEELSNLFHSAAVDDDYIDYMELVRQFQVPDVDCEFDPMDKSKQLELDVLNRKNAESLSRTRQLSEGLHSLTSTHSKHKPPPHQSQCDVVRRPPAMRSTSSLSSVLSWKEPEEDRAAVFENPKTIASRWTIQRPTYEQIQAERDTTQCVIPTSDCPSFLPNPQRLSTTLANPKTVAAEDIERRAQLRDARARRRNENQDRLGLYTHTEALKAEQAQVRKMFGITRTRIRYVDACNL